MKKPILSICIPTYNREKYLKRLLDSIVNQDFFSDHIEIVINDWPSIDNTKELVSFYQKKYKNIKYFRNNKAVWMSPAIIETVDYSTWEYTWIFSSDDVMNKDSLKNILFVINKEKPVLIITNRFVFYKEDEYKKQRNLDLKYNSYYWFDKFSEYLWKNINETLIEKMDYFTFMSIACFKTEHYRKSFKNIIENKNIHIDELKLHYFNWALIIYSNLWKQDKISLIGNKEVFAQADNCWWKKNQKIIDDLIWLFDSLWKDYNVGKGWKAFFSKTISYRKFSFSILHPIIDNKLILFIKRNKFTKKIYIFFADIINFIIKKII